MAETLRIGLAAARNAPTVNERMETAKRFLKEAAARDVAIVCFPETYIPGLRGLRFPRSAARPAPAAGSTGRDQRRGGASMAWRPSSAWSGKPPPERTTSRSSSPARGRSVGYQAKNQIPLEEEPHYVPEGRRRLFEIDGVPFGITICHEGWRYPEATRWSATRGARLVFHPQMTGSDHTGPTIDRWGDPSSPYYEKAMIARSVENTIYFASVNYALRYQESATSVIDPDGACEALVPYGEEQLLVHDLDLSRATGLCARRFNPAFYPPA